MQSHIENILITSLCDAELFIGSISDNSLMYRSVIAVLQQINDTDAREGQTVGDALVEQQHTVTTMLASMKAIVSTTPDHPPHLFTIVSALNTLWADALKNKLNGPAMSDLLRYRIPRPKPAPTNVRTIKRVA